MPGKDPYPYQGAAFGFKICSNTPLPFQSDKHSKLDTLFWNIHPASTSFPKLEDVHVWKNAAGKIALQAGFSPEGERMLEVPKLGRFWIEAETGIIHGFPLKGTPAREMTQQFLTQILPLCFSSLGLLVLHAGVLQFKRGAWLFVGASGQGKSTLAASLAQRKASVLSDDTAVLEFPGKQWTVRPGFPAIRLHPGTIKKLGLKASGPAYQNGKQWSALPPISSKPVRIAGICFLDTAEKLQWKSITASDAFPRLLTQTFRLNSGVDAALTHEFQQLTQLLKQAPCFVLSYPRDWKALPDVCEWVRSKTAK